MPINPLADYLDQLPTDPKAYTKETIVEYLNEIAKFKNDGIDFNQPDEDGLTPLLIAIDKHPQLVTALLDNGADPNIADVKSGTTPLHLACFNGNRKIADALIKRGANVNAEDNNKDTPMHMAFLSKNSKLVGLLITSGANQNAINNDGNTPYQEFEKDQILSQKFSDPIRPTNHKAKKMVSFAQQTAIESKSPPSPRSVMQIEDLAMVQALEQAQVVKEQITNFHDDAALTSLSARAALNVILQFEKSLVKTNDYKERPGFKQEIDRYITELNAQYGSGNQTNLTEVFKNKDKEINSRSSSTTDMILRKISGRATDKDILRKNIEDLNGKLKQAAREEFRIKSPTVSTNGALSRSNTRQ